MRVLHGGGPAADIIFVPQYVTVVGLHFKWYMLYIKSCWVNLIFVCISPIHFT
jgi:hypothetical protein